MVVTHKTMAERKKKPIIRKEDDLRRKFMTKAQALAENLKLKQDKEAVAKYARDLAEARKAGKTAPKDPTTKPTPEYDKVELAKKVGELEFKMKSFKGPGSKAKREDIRQQILALNEKKAK